MRFNSRCAILALLLLFGAGTQQFTPAQGLGKFDRDNAIAMLDAAKDDLKKNYYDPALRGIDIETKFKDAKERVKQATSRDQLIITVAQTLLDFDDSHTFFVPPSRAAKVEYGWEMQMVGDAAFVTGVKPKTDAEAKGLKPGDQIVSVDGYTPTRENMWKMYYRYYALMPARGMRLMVRSPDQAEPRELEVLAKIERGANVVDWSNLFVRFLRERRDVGKDRTAEFGNELLIWQMTTFSTSEDHIDAMMGKASKFKSLLIDLRGNGGGYTDALSRLTSYFFDREVKIADQKGRKETKPLLAKPRGSVYKGQVIVLIDSDSASASEVFARTLQLEKRGTVLGDRSMGAVMTSRYYDHQTGVGQVLYFGNSITVGDVIMPDGKSLEKTGVTPDETMLPTGADLAAKRDPVLSRAAEMLGVKLDPEKAGTLFPKEWRN
ncbi:MAG TPA: S41 family peptidase [Pyrinomonadaceae bacterium]|nr:S41 family peptidase [Pyrinomonadaceae bacterium]